jgi:Carboxypeptidase regulatory-like domain
MPFVEAMQHVSSSSASMSHKCGPKNPVMIVQVIAGFVLLCSLFSACTSNNPPSPNNIPASSGTLSGNNVPASSGTLSGKVVDSHGQPVSNALIVMTGATTRLQYTTTTKSDGTYSQKVSDDSYSIDAYAQPNYQGESWKLPLYPEDTSGNPVDSVNGGGKNFIWKLTGMIVGQTDQYNPQTRYGASVSLANLNNPPGATYEITLTPTGPLVDGSTGQAISFKRTVDNAGIMNEGDYLLDIPLGTYTIAGMGADANGNALTLSFSKTNITFQPVNDFGTNGIALPHIDFSVQ